MNKQEKKYFDLAIYSLELKRKDYVANASVKEVVFVFQARAKEHLAEYDEAIKYFKELRDKIK